MTNTKHECVNRELTRAASKSLGAKLPAVGDGGLDATGQCTPAFMCDDELLHVCMHELCMYA
jgi:hypothetical protein